MTAPGPNTHASAPLGRLAPTTRTAKTTPRTQAQLFVEAEKTLPDLDAAVDFLCGKQLVPVGDASVSEEALISGLLHFAVAAPAKELARKGLIAFAHLAKAVLARKNQDSVSAEVAERVETQITQRLDHHTTKVEELLEEAVSKVEETRKEMDGWMDRLMRACNSVDHAEASVAEVVRKELASANLATGTPSPPSEKLTLDSAPARTRRAVNLAELLQRQVLVKNMILKDTEGQLLNDREALERARQAMDMMAREGLTPPNDTQIEAAKICARGDVVFTMSSANAARWLLRTHAATAFSRKMGGTARLVERTYKLVAERVPVEFDPADQASLRQLEQAHELRQGAIVRADWIKPVAKRFSGQRTAFLLLTVSGVDQANIALKGLTFAGRGVIVRRDLLEPKRCARCQKYDGHFAKDCPAPGDVCATCAGPHPSAHCDCSDPSLHRCANCGVDGHAAWDKACPVFLEKVRTHSARRADSGFRFFVTNNPETWISDGEELARAPPPPPTFWSQIRHHFDGPDPTQQGPSQARLDHFFAQSQQTAPASRNL